MDRIENLLKISASYALPVFVALLINLGVIFNLNNFVEAIPIIGNIVSYLSIIRPTTIVTNLLVGATTAFVIFFALAPVSYTREYLPSRIIHKYIFKHTVTYQYLLSELWLILVLGYFSFTDRLLNVNIILCITYLVLSISISILYFYWFTRQIQPDRIFPSIFDHIDFQKVSETEVELSGNRRLYNRRSQTHANLFKISTNELESVFLHPDYEVQHQINGLVENIEINKLFSIIKPFKSQISEIRIHVKIGESYPKPDYYPFSYGSAPDALISIFYDLNDNDQNNRIIESQKLSKKIAKVEPEIIGCFKINESRNLRFKYSKNIDDLFLIYEKIGFQDWPTTKVLIESVNEFIAKEYSDEKIESWDTEVSIKQDLFKYIISRFRETSRQLTEEQFRELLSPIYILSDLSIKRKSQELIFTALESMHTFLFNIHRNSDKYIPNIANFLLNIQEVSISYEFRHRLNDEPRDLRETEWDRFYSGIVNKGMATAISCYYYLIEFFNSKPVDHSTKYLIYNSQYLVDFLHRLVHLADFELLKSKVERKFYYLA